MSNWLREFEFKICGCVEYLVARLPLYPEAQKKQQNKNEKHNIATTYLDQASATKHDLYWVAACEIMHTFVGVYSRLCVCVCVCERERERERERDQQNKYFPSPKHPSAT